jgi:hypothetical protein
MARSFPASAVAHSSEQTIRGALADVMHSSQSARPQ